MTCDEAFNQIRFLLDVGGSDGFSARDIESLKMAMSALQVENRRINHAKWIKARYKKLSKTLENKINYKRHAYDPATDLYTSRFKCSACGRDSFMPETDLDRYCKHCGRHMDAISTREVQNG